MVRPLSPGDRGRGAGILSIFAYHHIGEPSTGGWRTWFYVPEEIFIGHLRILEEERIRVLDAGSFVGGLDDPSAWPDRVALITFDDGYHSVLDVARPHLEAFGFPGVLFVPTGYIGGVNAFDAGNQPEERICTWEELRMLERAGISVQCHGVSHRKFSSLSVEERERELLEGKAVLETGLGKRVDLFAYPYGDVGAGRRPPEELVRAAGYRAACLYGGGPISFNPGDPLRDRYRLPRLAIGPETDLREAFRGG